MNFRNVYIETLRDEFQPFPVLQTFTFLHVHNYVHFLFITVNTLLKNNFYEIYQFIENKIQINVWTSPISTDALLFTNRKEIEQLFEEIQISKKYTFLVCDSFDLYCEIQPDPTLFQELIHSLQFHKIQSIIDKCKSFIDEHLIPLIDESQEGLEGNLFMSHHTTYTDLFKQKLINFINLLSYRGSITNILEIGFNSGFSALLMLLTNSHVKLTCVDLGEHRYTLPCFRVLKQHFGDRIHLIIGDSQHVLPTLHHKYELIHIDGGHFGNIPENDIVNTYPLTRVNTVLIMDDTNYQTLKDIWVRKSQEYCYSTFAMKEIAFSPHHDINIRVK
jgi:predicted O-methyltransferase YrrM